MSRPASLLVAQEEFAIGKRDPISQGELFHSIILQSLLEFVKGIVGFLVDLLVLRLDFCSLGRFFRDTLVTLRARPCEGGREREDEGK